MPDKKLLSRGDTERMKTIESAISEFKRIELEEEQKAKRKEKWQVNINPNSLIGREIKYQTALMHEILSELRKQTEILRNLREGKDSPSYGKD